MAKKISLVLLIAGLFVFWDLNQPGRYQFYCQSGSSDMRKFDTATGRVWVYTHEYGWSELK
jgi:hypothetical protein